MAFSNRGSPHSGNPMMPFNQPQRNLQLLALDASEDQQDARSAGEAEETAGSSAHEAGGR